MAELEGEAAARGTAPGYVAKLLAAYRKEPAPSQEATAGAPAAQTVVELLSERELEVLRLLAERLTNREIAEELKVMAGTAKTQVSHIHGTLGVHSRTRAVVRSRRLGLLGS